MIERAFVARLAAGRRVKIAGPHALHASHPAEVAQAILDFASGNVRHTAAV